MGLLKPTVLIVTTSRWFPTARLAVALANAGFQVQALCPSAHPISKTNAVKRTFLYHGLAPLKSFAAAIAATRPDLLVSGDDLATWHLHDLYGESSHAGASGAAVRQLIERSLGAPEFFPAVDDRARFIQLASEFGVRVPANATIATSEALIQWIATSTFPAVLKANGTSGGTGVRIVHNAQDAERARKVLQAPPLLARAAKRALIDHDATLIWPSVLRKKSQVNAQSFICGREATSAVVCWQGSVLASLHFVVLQKSDAAGHATVLRRIAHPEMAATAETMVHRLQLSGFHGFDFMLAEQTQAAHLIEINPRATQVCHLNFGPGHDLPSALLSAVTGSLPEAPPSVTQNDTIALFPQEWLRDPSSPFLRSAFHDVPWDQPELLRACVRKRPQSASTNAVRTQPR
jgi:hypothetical protein